jgi:hypothetical protein
VNKTIDFYTSEHYYADHFWMVWNALPKQHRGWFIVKNDFIEQYLIGKGVPSEDILVGKPRHHLTLVSSWGDYKHTTSDCVYLDHGIGFSFSNNHPSYLGSKGKDRVVKFLLQHDHAVAKNQPVYPRTPHVVVGTPKMDSVPSRGVTGRVVAISFHWDAKVAPETLSAFRHYKRHLPRLAKEEDFTLIGHAHPRPGWQDQVKKILEPEGVKFYENFDDILELADVYVVDNSSTMMEFAAAGRPVVALNAPWYRKHVNHGLRFWDYIPGPQVDEGRFLAPTIRHVLDDPGKWEQQRLECVEALYPHRAKATQRAVAEIKQILI